MEQEEQVVQGMPDWLGLFFQISFFGYCSVHQQRNIKNNHYCIDCNLPKCRYCVSSSGSCHGHRTMKLYRYVFEDSILESDITKFMDASDIQLYKCNQEWVVCKEHLPIRSNVANSSSSCATCTRILYDPDLYSYCSLDCKVKAFSSKLRPTDPPFLEIGAAAAAATAAAVAAERLAERKKRRKGVPRRAI